MSFCPAAIAAICSELMLPILLKRAPEMTQQFSGGGRGGRRKTSMEHEEEAEEEDKGGWRQGHGGASYSEILLARLRPSNRHFRRRWKTAHGVSIRKFEPRVLAPVRDVLKLCRCAFFLVQYGGRARDLSTNVCKKAPGS